MKLYTLDGSRYGGGVVIQILAKGLDVDIHSFAYPLPPAIKALNPMGVIPILEADGAYVFESQVIGEFLEDLGKGPSLRPRDPHDRARMRLLIRLFELRYEAAVRPVSARYLGSDDPVDPAFIDGALAEIRRGIQLISDQLDGTMYAVGDQLTLADCALMPLMLSASIKGPLIGIGDPIAMDPKVARYFERTRRDPFVAQVLDGMETAFHAAVAKIRRGV